MVNICEAVCEKTLIVTCTYRVYISCQTVSDSPTSSTRQLNRNHNALHMP